MSHNNMLARVGIPKILYARGHRSLAARSRTREGGGAASRDKAERCCVLE